MNIVWIMADTYRGDALGVLGHPVVKTPCLDGLARTGTIFENTFAQSPLCCPSRVCSFTSRYVHAHGTWWNGVPYYDRVSLLPEILRRNGYRTGLIGKLHFYPQDLAHGFDHKELHEEAMPEELNAYHTFLARQTPPGKDPFQSTEWGEVPDVGVCRMPEEQEETRWVADRASAFLKENRDQPFFLFASFIRPHMPYNPLPRFLDMYKDARIEPPAFDPREWDRKPDRVRAHARMCGWDKLSPQDTAAIQRHYYALCTMVDESVGRILQSIEQANLGGDTLVLFSSDHGDFLGEHGHFHKMHLWDGALHVPLILRDPRRRGGTRYAGLVQSIDVMPTLLDLAGIEKPAHLQGCSFAPALDNPAAPHREAVFAEYAHHSIYPGWKSLYASCRDMNSISIRTDRWKYIHYPGEPGELYDIAADPRERHNRVDDPGMQSVRQDLVEQLLDWRTRMQDMGYARPDPRNPYFERYFRDGGR